MFEFLTRVPTAVATEAVYEAALRMFERTRLADASASRAGSEPMRSSRAAPEPDVAAGILREIERTEAKPLPELSDDEVERYTARLLTVLEERMRVGRRVDARKAKALLDDLRLTYAR
jgi:hypothetical protein